VNLLERKFRQSEQPCLEGVKGYYFLEERKGEGGAEGTPKRNEKRISTRSKEGLKAGFFWNK